MLDKKRAEEAFDEYTSKYDRNNSMIQLKVDHTMRVADNCERIAKTLFTENEKVELAWLLGLLHDFGRFEQVRRFNTFVDSVSVDHAELGADLLFKENLIKEFPIDDMSAEHLTILETAIRLHNKLALPKDLDEQMSIFCNLIRDADKADIFRVITELPYEDRIGSSKNLYSEEPGASDIVMELVLQHRCVPREIKKTRFDGYISHCCMAFEVMFPESRRIIREQGYLDKLLRESQEDGNLLWTEREQEQISIVRREIEDAWGDQ